MNGNRGATRSAKGGSNGGAIPAGFFGIAVGALAFANLWRVAIRVWDLPAIAGTALTVAALALWLVLLAAYAHKWFAHTAEARAELEHPVQSSFVALAPVATLLAAQLLQPYAHTLALSLYGVATLAQLALGVYLQGKLWQGGRQPELTTPAIYLPTVGAGFVAATSSAAFGFHQLGELFFGAGALAWLALESMILQRAAVHEPLPEALRPTLGIQLAPPVVGGVAYLSLTSGAPDLFAYALLGYGLYQGLLLLRLLPWIRRQAFVAGYWAFSFGVAALPTMVLRLLERGATGPLEWAAPVLFVAANAIIAILVVKTLGLLVQGKLIPPAASAPASTTAAASATGPAKRIATSPRVARVQ
ncbi:dicarboxylate transporter/tellurite-resistance protein TehA [Paraburkholderia sp. MMS20-SJTR3]|uniref:Dicarboxylate transporter/tellurite-resistance protein TehA n=1 Tax=Paraburkholderia sejongensis TaxID=2886946 RepID=A0ABS8JSP1_9BURK|nr:dicarboxylate transporter/tellurite-resistance protein TehA [Paraburkholderia sp. MMS20-SJTR3]MCC8392743.1 dicarboxylate transporter/tellurite-resistance protein TehA [Paraburkholderia sp. MMS20-SJTR3]